MNGDGDAALKGKKVEDIMTTDVVSFKTTSNVADICQCFMNYSFRRVPIVEDDKLVGLISRKDIIYKTFEKI
jgi:CBS domain-containing protein